MINTDVVAMIIYQLVVLQKGLKAHGIEVKR